MTAGAARPGDAGSDNFRATALRVLALCLAMAAVLGVSGAARSAADLAEWTGECMLGAAVGLAAGRWFVPRAWYGARIWAAALTVACVVAAPVAIAVFVVQDLAHHQPPTWTLAAHVAPSVLGTSLVMTGLAFLMRRPAERAPAADGLGAAGGPAKFLARLPEPLRGADLYAVESEDHYLRLHTSLGQDLILMRLSDAVLELAGLDGAQTHRSWWVARAGVASAERTDGRAVLTLKDGARAPVSRAFAKRLRDARWF